MTRTVVIWGTSSGAGKSLLATALCRWAARQGMVVRPFKAQNMSNNARVVPGLDGGVGEIGSAQYFQALAARAQPHVDMNPVLLKPERDTASQVLVQGRVVPELARQPWRARSAALAQAARQSFDRLFAGLQVAAAAAGAPGLIVVEGAGSPAEINLAAEDYVNLGTARWAQALGPCRALLVTDIDRGGAFAHLYGTCALLPDDLRACLAGFVLNKFRGDAALLAPGPEQLQALTGVPLLGVLPMWREHGLPDEDGLYDLSARPARADRLTVAIIATPHISNLDEFQPLMAAASVRWVRHPDALAEAAADWIVLPGSKQVSGDLAWLQAQGLDNVIHAHAQAGRPLLGICGGLQMLGERLADPDGVDGEAHGPMAGLGLLPLATHYAAPKRLRAAPVRFDAESASAASTGWPHGPWAALQGLSWPAYEIRCGRTRATRDSAQAVLWDDQREPVGWCGGPHGNVLGIATHGLFESADALRRLLGREVRTLDDSLDGLAEWLESNVGAGPLRGLVGV